jgi:predicted acyl esterase
LRFELLDMLHRFQKGHRLMVQIQSTWFPLVDRNPQKYVPNIYFAAPDDFQKATHRVYRSPDHATSLRLGALPTEPKPNPVP